MVECFSIRELHIYRRNLGLVLQPADSFYFSRLRYIDNWDISKRYLQVFFVWFRNFNASL